MTREEIEQAIENGESVYFFYNEVMYKLCNDYTLEIVLKNDMSWRLGKFELYDDKILINDVDVEFHKQCFYDNEITLITKAEAEHYLRHANVSRTETLPFLTWEEFLSEKRIKFRSKYNEEYELSIINSKILLRVNGTANITLSMEATEANFYKAYDECVRLFKGE